MRKLCLTLVAGAAMLSTGTLTQGAAAMTPGAASGLRAAIADTGVVDQVGLVCTHFWNGRWHRFEQCFWSGHHHRHHYHHRHHHHRR
jgi:hypothetical protein